MSQEGDKIKEAIARRAEELNKVKVFSDATVVMASVLKRMCEDMFALCKECNAKIEYTERNEWNHILTSVTRLNTLAMANGNNMYQEYKKVVNLVYFLIRELIAKCDDSDLRIWQFHNLLKSFPTVRPEVAPSYEDELNAFQSVIGN